MEWRGGRYRSLGWFVGVAVVWSLLIWAGVAGYSRLRDPGSHAGDAADPVRYVAIDRAPTAPPAPTVQPGGSTGTWRTECGRNEEGRHNSDNLVNSPGMVGGAHHVHDYVGNVSTTALSTDESLAAAPTTCRDDDRSTYYWPVLRLAAGHEAAGHGAVGRDAAGHEADGDGGGHRGPILVPDSVLLEYRGNATSNVVPMPRFLRGSTGDPHGWTNGGANTDHVQWTCSGARDRATRWYPRCPAGQRVVRIFDFPSCWNGKATDSANHRTHLVFPDRAGACPLGTFPVPQLHVEIAYAVPSGAGYVIDSFPEERNSSVADHAHFVDVMPDALMARAVDCINAGRRC